LRAQGGSPDVPQGEPFLPDIIVVGIMVRVRVMANSLQRSGERTRTGASGGPARTFNPGYCRRAMNTVGNPSHRGFSPFGNTYEQKFGSMRPGRGCAVPPRNCGGDRYARQPIVGGAFYPGGTWGQSTLSSVCDFCVSHGEYPTVLSRENDGSGYREVRKQNVMSITPPFPVHRPSKGKGCAGELEERPARDRGLRIAPKASNQKCNREGQSLPCEAESQRFTSTPASWAGQGRQGCKFFRY